jgi:hypothetical protein
VLTLNAVFLSNLQDSKFNLRISTTELAYLAHSTYMNKIKEGVPIMHTTVSMETGIDLDYESFNPSGSFFKRTCNDSPNLYDYFRKSLSNSRSTL